MGGVCKTKFSTESEQKHDFRSILGWFYGPFEIILAPGDSLWAPSLAILILIWTGGKNIGKVKKAGSRNQGSAAQGLVLWGAGKTSLSEKSIAKHLVKRHSGNIA